MALLRVTTWNVLHRVHAVNWKEPEVEAFPDERGRIARITERVAAWLGAEADVVCLQEVSGDQLASLREAVSGAADVFEHRYPRVPRRRDGGAPELVDPTEHLVVLVASRGAHVLGARTFDTDPGKGFLAVEIAQGVVVIGTHVTYGPRGGDQIALLAETARARAGVVAIAGDWNAPADAVRAGLGEGFVVTSLEGQPATRSATAESPAQTIDHVAVIGGRLESPVVLDATGLSDHNPVSARVRFG